MLSLVRNHAIARINPMSPMQLYRIACRAAVFASAHPYHHLMSKNDIIPTPSQPMSNRNKVVWGNKDKYGDKK